MIVEGKDPLLAEKAQEELNAEANAVIKLMMSEMERLASLPPVEANEPVAFNRARHAMIRKLWSLVKAAVRYGEARQAR